MEEPISEKREMTPEEKEFSNAFKEYMGELNSHGNRRLEHVLNKPFRIFQATMDRWKFIKSKQPKELQDSPGMAWEKLGAIIQGIANEIGVGIGDTIWDVATTIIPVNLIWPRIKHPFFKTTIQDLYSPSMVAAIMGGEKLGSFFTSAGEELIHQPT